MNAFTGDRLWTQAIALASTTAKYFHFSLNAFLVARCRRGIKNAYSGSKVLFVCVSLSADVEAFCGGGLNQRKTLKINRDAHSRQESLLRVTKRLIAERFWRILKNFNVHRALSAFHSRENISEPRGMSELYGSLNELVVVQDLWILKLIKRT